MRTFDNYLSHNYERRSHHYDVILCDFIFFFLEVAETGFHTVLRDRAEKEKTCCSVNIWTAEGRVVLGEMMSRKQDNKNGLFHSEVVTFF